MGFFAILIGAVDRASAQRQGTVDPATSKHSCFLLPNLISTCSHGSQGMSVTNPWPVCLHLGSSVVPVRKRSKAELASVLTVVSLTEDGTGKMGKVSPRDLAKSFPSTIVAHAHTC